MNAIAPPRPPIIGIGRPDGPLDGDVGNRGGGRGWVTLTRAPNDIEAHLLMGRLFEAGVETSGVKERNTSPSWAYGGSNPWAPVLVMVRRYQLDEARMVLAEVAYDAPAARHIEPPDPVQHRRRALVWWALAVSLGLLFTALSYVQTAKDAERCRNDPACAADMESR